MPATIPNSLLAKALELPGCSLAGVARIVADPSAAHSVATWALGALPHRRSALGKTPDTAARKAIPDGGARIVDIECAGS